jgi:hypothetical protein
MDLDLAPHLADLLDRALAAVQRDEHAVGLVVNGSVAAGTADEYSDLDLVVVYDDIADLDLPGRARRIFAELGDGLVSFSGEHVGEPALVIGLVDGPVRHVDVKCVRVGDQRHRVEDGVVVWQRGTAVDDARLGTVASWPGPDPQWLEDRFWVWVHYSATKAARGELLECIESLGFLRSVVLGPLIDFRRGVRPAGVRRLERTAPDLLPQLHATVAAPERRACLDALVAAADLYVRVRPDGLRRQERAESAVRAYVAALLEPVREPLREPPHEPLRAHE